jgi:hypothetical protein
MLVRWLLAYRKIQTGCSCLKSKSTTCLVDVVWLAWMEWSVMSQTHYLALD